MSLFTDLKEVFTAYAQRIKGLAAADEKIKADLDAYDDAIREEIGNVGWNRITFSSDSFIDLSGSTADVTHMSSPGYGFSCAVMPCSAGDKFLLNLTGGGKSRAWGFVAANGKVISVADANTTVSNYTLTAPTNAAYLVVHDSSGRKSYKKGETVAEIIESKGGLSDAAKRALMACFDNVGWAGTDGSTYCDALRSALGLVVWDYDWDATSRINPPDMTAYNFDFSAESGALKIIEPNFTLNYDTGFEFIIECKFPFRSQVSNPKITYTAIVSSHLYNVTIQPNPVASTEGDRSKIAIIYDWSSSNKRFINYVANVYHTYRVLFADRVIKTYIDGTLVDTRTLSDMADTLAEKNYVKISCATDSGHAFDMYVKNIKFRSISGT